MKIKQPGVKCGKKMWCVLNEGIFESVYLADGMQVETLHVVYFFASSFFLNRQTLILQPAGTSADAV